MINPGDKFICAICTAGVVEIPLDSNPDALELVNDQYGDAIPALLCSVCSEHIAGKTDRRRIVVWTGKTQ